jgi:hypothetical protein
LEPSIWSLAKSNHFIVLDSQLHVQSLSLDTEKRVASDELDLDYRMGFDIRKLFDESLLILQRLLNLVVQLGTGLHFFPIYHLIYLWRQILENLLILEGTGEVHSDLQNLLDLLFKLI